MRKLIFLALLAAAGWYVYQQILKTRTAQQIQQAPVQYVNGLQHDVQKAKDVEQKANQIIRQTSNEVKDLTKQAEQ